MISSYLKIALRNIIKYRLFSIINVFGLTVGIASAITIYLWVKHEKSYDNFFSKKEQIFLLLTKNSESAYGNNYTPYALSKRLAETYPEIINYTRHENNSLFQSIMVKYINGDGEIEKFFYENRFFLGDTSFFDIFDFPFVFGQAENALQSENSLVITKETAHKYFGDKNPIGEKLLLNNKTEYAVTGVINIPSNSNFYFDFLAVNTSIRDRDYLNGWDSNGPSYILVEEHASIDKLREKVSVFLDTVEEINSEDIVVDFIHIHDAHLYYGLEYIVIIIQTIGILILLIAILNYINLSVALFAQRAKEVALKKVSGSNKTSIIIQLLIESVIITTIAINFSIIIIKVILPYFSHITDRSIHLSDIGSGFEIAFFIILFALSVGIISGLYPAITLASYKTVKIIKSSKNSGSKVSFSRKLIVMFQFLVSISLIASTLIIYKQRHLLNNRPLGFNKDYVIKIPINTQLLKHFESFRNELLKNPDILNTTAASTVPSGIGNHSGVRWGSGPEDFDSNVKFAIVMPGYINTFNMELVRGQVFNFDRTNSLKGYILNESAAKMTGFNDPVNRSVNFWGRDGVVIGVIKDFENNFLGQQLMPLILSANPDNWFFLKFVFIKISSQNIQESINYLNKVSKKFAPDFPFEYEFVDDVIDEYLEDHKRFNNIFIIFSIIAILIASFGLFGMTLFSAERRTKEIGVRKANGAKTMEIMFMLLKDFTIWVVIAFIIACPLVYLFMKMWLQIFGYRTSLSWWIFALAGVIVFLIALLTVSWQSYRAASKNPVEALRYE
jgi:putative ABC transport system permease protein